jgi:hypothetical protein
MATLFHYKLQSYKVFPFAFAVLCLILAITLRALIPAGYMPDLKASQPFKMVVCTLDGPKTVIVDDTFDPHKGDTHDKKSASDHDGPCGFSVNTAFTNDAPYASAVLEQILVSSKVSLSKVNPVIQERFYGNTASRAPPVFSIV